MTIEDRYYGDVADTYDIKRRNTRTRAAEDAAFERLFASIRRRKAIATVLDLPCGTGRWIERFHQAGLDYTGVDISADMLRHSQREIDRLGAGNARIVEASCFEYLPRHTEAFDVVVSTRFINWWDEPTGLKLLKLFCASSRRYVLLHIRLDETPLQRALGLALRYPNRIRKALKEPSQTRRELRRIGRVLGFSRTAPLSRHPYISYHNRARVIAALGEAGCRLDESIVLKKHMYGSVEFWLIQKQPT